MALSDKAIAAVGPDNIARNSNLGRVMRRRGVARTAEFRRVEALPRREWERADDLDDLVVGLTEWLRPRPPPGQREMFDAPDEPFTLKPIQAAALREIHDRRGAFLPIAVGGGKAFITLLAPVVLEAERPVLFVPSDLREQTKRKVIPLAARHFRLHPRLKVIGNHELSVIQGEHLLDELMPDVIVLDECHEYSRKSSGRTKRMIRYLKEHPEVIVVATSGTASSRSLKDYHHIIQWCLGIDRAPLPEKWREVSDWADALDEGVPDERRMAPGALEAFCAPGENARQGYRRRLTQTPGVIASGAEELGVSLRIRKLDHRLPPLLSRMISDVRETWEDPNGGALAEAIEVWRIARQISLGFWYEWVPPAPREWLDARRDWKAHVRDTLRHNRRRLDTELQVWNEAARDGTLPAWKAWAAIKDSFKPNPVAQWLDFGFVDVVRRWIAKGPGIVWVDHTAVGERLSSELGIPYFGAGAKASRDILDASGPIVASTHAHHKGKNLQGQWSRNLVTSPRSSGKLWEQLMGRTHRQGQPADEVTFDVNLSDQSLMDSFRQALADARYLEDTLGARQRLLYADIAFEV